MRVLTGTVPHIAYLNESVSAIVQVRIETDVASNKVSQATHL